ncbi:MAG: right-handed parallel beta-helix repeat-containing protein [Terriglobia bacterium]|jgi:hypothetical protein
MHRKFFALLLFVVFRAPAWVANADSGIAVVSADMRNEAAVKQVLAGQREDANAAWWGFDAADSTAALQAAIDSHAKRVLVPYMGAPWIVRPITLRSDQEIDFEPGVLILAKRGEFQGQGDSLLSAVGVSNLTLRGYGATLRMWKKDYQNPPYKKAEWRMGIAIHGCRNVRVEGLRVESSGGDGFYVDGGAGREWSEDITIRNCVAYDNHRQGISVISVVNLLVENCTFAATGGTAPEAGIDIEPDAPQQRLVNCVIRNCIFEDNHGQEIVIYLRRMDHTTEPVSIRFENCLSRQTDPTIGGSSGMAVGRVRDDGPKGLIEFINCVSENTGGEGAKVYDKSANAVLVRFVRCKWSSPWMSARPQYAGPRVPVLIESRLTIVTTHFGGVEFKDCYVFDNVNRPALQVEEVSSELGVRGVHGLITVQNPSGARMRLGHAPVDADVQVAPANPPQPAAGKAP